MGSQAAVLSLVTEMNADYVLVPISDGSARVERNWHYNLFEALVYIGS